MSYRASPGLMQAEALHRYNQVKYLASQKPALGSHLVTISDQDVADTGLDTGGYCYVTLPGHVGQVMEAKVVASCFTNSTYNVDAHNCTFRVRCVTPGDTTYSVSIANKQYSGDALATALQTALNLVEVGAVFTVSFDSSTYMLTTTRTDGGSFQIIVNRDHDMWRQLGLLQSVGTYPVAGPSTTLTSSNPIYLSGPVVLYVTVDGLNRAQTANGFNYVTEIQLSDSFLSRNSNTFVSNSIVLSNGGDIKGLRVGIFLDNKARTPWNPRNLPWRVSLELTTIQ